MQKTKPILSLVLLIVSLLSASCSEMNSTTQPTKEEDNSVVDLIPKICYDQGLNCLAAIDSKVVATDNTDYKYPDSKSFPDPELQPVYMPPDLLIKLDQKVETKMLSKNFQAVEFMSSVKGAYGFVAPHLVATLQKIRDIARTPIRINSGYRSPGYNSKLSGSAKWSRHTYGDAVDLQIPSLELSDVKRLCEDEDASFILVYTSHVHCDWRLVDRNKSRIDRYRLIAEGTIVAKPTSRGDYQLSVSGLNSEDPEQLVYEWTVLFPDGQTKFFTSETVTLSSPKGQYNVQAVVGMTVELNESFSW